MALRIGLEIGTRTVRAVWTAGGRGWERRVRTRAADAAATLAQDLAALLGPLRRRRLSAALALVAPASSVRLLTIRARDAKHVPAALADALPGVLPFEIARAQISHQVRRSSRAGDAADYTVSVAACEREALAPMLDALWRAGWAPSAVVPSGAALAQAAAAGGRSAHDTVLLVDLGASRTTVTLLDEGSLAYSRDVALGVEHMTEALTGQISVGGVTWRLSWEDAERLLRETGMPASDQILRFGGRELPASAYLGLVQPILEHVLSEIRRTMAFGSQTASVASPQRVLLSGPGGVMPGLAEWCGQHLGLPTELLDVSQWLGADGAADALLCGAANGARTAALDLQPAAARQRQAFLVSSTRLTQLLAVCTLALWLGTAWWHWQRRDLAQAAAALDARSAALQPVVAVQEALASQDEVERQLLSGQPATLDWFRRLADDFPNAVRLSELVVEQTGAVKMRGEAEEREQSPEASVSELALWLDAEGLCQAAQVDSTERPDAAEPLMAFALSCQL